MVRTPGFGAGPPGNQPDTAHGGTITTTAVLLAGCTSGNAGKAEADPPEAAASETSPAAEATAEPTEDTAEAIDPCSLMPRSTWHRLVDPDELISGLPGAEAFGTHTLTRDAPPTGSSRRPCAL